MESIFLTGFMATGKSAVGREIAARLSMPFVDTDAEVETAAGMTIAEIFRRGGEAEFRDRERQALARACEVRGAVVATGGGAIVDLRNRERMRAAGKIVCLAASPEAILARLGEGDERPLLAGELDRVKRIRELLAEREGAYSAADWTVDTSGLTPSETAEAIVRWLRACSVDDVEGPRARAR